jgi:predicted nuclease of restriction endonuclease-like RecB superfamily
VKNKFEIKIYAQLKRAGIRFRYEGTKIPYVLSGHYIPDFVIITPTGLVYVETKGYLRPEHKRKMVAVKRQHPEIDLRILFYAPKKEYIKWAEKNGIKYAISTIPQEWLDGF